jgi:hypothetical protein
MSTPSGSSSSSSLGQAVSSKLTRDNLLLWKAQVMPVVRGAQLFGFLDSTTAKPVKTDPAHGVWVAQDQQVLGFLNASLS